MHPIDEKKNLHLLGKKFKSELYIELIFRNLIEWLLKNKGYEKLI